MNHLYMKNLINEIYTIGAIMSRNEKRKKAEKYCNNIVEFRIQKSSVDQEISELAVFLGISFECMKARFIKK